ncbi:MAG: serine/threonine-protein kinase, partial [Acidobacteriota bacterium]
MAADVDKALLLKVAEAIADRTPVDWEGDREKGAGLESSLKQFRIIESVAAIHEVKDVVEAPDARDLLETVTEPSEPSKISTGGPIPKRWGPLQIKERIGGGGFGEIFRAYDPNLKIDVALKLLRRDRPGGDAADERFLDEARRLARVRHSNVLVVHGAERHDGRVGIWSDLIDGKTLEDRLQAEGPSSPQEAALIGIDLCHALAAVHQQGLVHGDVKTSNVMRERQGNIILMDFSSASERFSAQPVSDQEAIHGTPFFMAPEVLMGERKCSPASDIYSLGVLLYRLVSGKFPVMADSLLNLCQKHRNREAVPIRDVRPDLSPQFVQVLDQALEREPEQRYGTAGEMERALKTVIGVPHKEMKPLPKRPWWSRRSLLAALGGVLVASVVIY